MSTNLNDESTIALTKSTGRGVVMVSEGAIDKQTPSPCQGVIQYVREEGL